MKAPDKIYMPNELLSEDWQRHIEGEDSCYIRKDTLLEWLEEKQGELVEKLEVKDNPVWWGQRNALQQVIDKINSL